MSERQERFQTLGHVGPVRVLSAAECRRFLMDAPEGSDGPPLEWFKSNATRSRAFFEIAMHPEITRIVADLLGEDFLLWGATIETRPSGAIHPWHTDIETSASSGNAVSVWIGLENTDRGSSLRFVPHSHRFGATVQEVRGRNGVSREETRDGEIERWARERDAQSSVKSLEMRDGEAVFFDGRLWHGSHNTSPNVRRALLLQYARPDLAIRIPDLTRLDWPFRFLEAPRPPCLMVRGNAPERVNRIVLGPTATGPEIMPPLASRVDEIRLPLPPSENGGWKPYPIFHGSTATLRSLSCHVSVLNPDRVPHPPHRHPEEEVLVVLAGEVELLLPDAPGFDGRLRPGELVYYPAEFAHTLRTVGKEPAQYLMWKWRDEKRPSPPGPPLSFGRFTLPVRAEAASGFAARPVFEGPTEYLEKVHCHFSTLTPGAGYEAHIDGHDVAIAVLEGTVETLGRTVSP
ncbi:MAG TPA: phytanoyl-CoA dioxygenase family protein, partial [Thermoanaerobaculia bacterium]